MKKHQEYIVETDKGLVKLDGPPKKQPRVTLTPSKPGKMGRKTEAPKTKRKVKEDHDGASDQT